MTEQEILDLFARSGALLHGHFKLTSGRHSDVYYEKFAILRDPAVCTPVCAELAARLASYRPAVVIGPTLGGVIIAYEVARHLGVPAVYAEPGDRGRVLKRGFSLEPGQKVVIVDDVLTTGRSLREVIDLVDSYRAEIAAVGLLLDRSGGTVSVEYPLITLATVSAASWEPEACPLCARGEPVTQRGSRRFAAGA